MFWRSTDEYLSVSLCGDTASSLGSDYLADSSETVSRMDLEFNRMLRTGLEGMPGNRGSFQLHQALFFPVDSIEVLKFSNEGSESEWKQPLRIPF